MDFNKIVMHSDTHQTSAQQSLETTTIGSNNRHRIECSEW